MFRTIPMMVVVLFAMLAGCGGDEAGDRPDGSTDTDTDTDADSDADAGTDTDTDFDFDTDYPYDLDAGLRCDGGVDVTQSSPDGVGWISTGVEHCPDGSAHRYTPVPCTTVAVECEEEYCPGGCPAEQVCADVSKAGGPLCDCIKPCASDGDCEPDEACVCGEAGASATRCLPADCRTDADCGGFECGLSEAVCWEVVRLACRTDDDECHGTQQCGSGLGDPYCSYQEYSEHWECWWSECD